MLDDGSRGGWVPEDDEDPDGAAGTAAVPCRRDVATDPDEGYEPVVPDGEHPPGVGRHRSPGRAVRWDPGRRGALSLWLAGLLAAVVVVGWTWLERPRVELVPPEPPGSTAPAPTPQVGEAAETASTVVVAVVGLVGRPGLVTVPSGARVADAIAAAGGLLPGTDPAAVNLAAVVVDGQQIAVGVPAAGAGPAESPGGLAAPHGGAVGGARVNLNTATAEDLDGLPGIGPVLARRIVAHRDERGPFRSVDQLDDVPGIGPAIAAELAELVTV